MQEEEENVKKEEQKETKLYVLSYFCETDRPLRVLKETEELKVETLLMT